MKHPSVCPGKGQSDMGKVGPSDRINMSNLTAALKKDLAKTIT